MSVTKTNQLRWLGEILIITILNLSFSEIESRKVRNIVAREDFNSFNSQKATGSYRGADKSLAPRGKKPTTATEDFDVNVPYLLS